MSYQKAKAVADASHSAAISLPKLLLLAKQIKGSAAVAATTAATAAAAAAAIATVVDWERNFWGSLEMRPTRRVAFAWYSQPVTSHI